MSEEKKNGIMIHLKSSDLGEILLKKGNKKGRYLKESGGERKHD